MLENFLYVVYNFYVVLSFLYVFFYDINSPACTEKQTRYLGDSTIETAKGTYEEEQLGTVPSLSPMVCVNLHRAPQH